jgi:hypothetical protein
MSMELTLEASENMPRHIILTLIMASGRSLSARMYAQSAPPAHALCYTVGALAQWYLDVKGRVLWHASTGFDLTETEVQRLKHALQSHGLELQNDFPAPAPIGPELAKRAAHIAATSSGDVNGVAPAPYCTGAGALEDVFDNFEATFLTAGESH